MYFSIGLNLKTTALVAVICGLGVVLYKKELENKSLKQEVERLKNDGGAAMC